MHIPVLLNEVIQFLNPADGSKFIDGTAGDGGYIREILRINPAAGVLGIDLDQTSLGKFSMQLAQESLSQKVILVPGNFSDIKQFARENDFLQADGVVLDLGFSSSQLDDPVRGLSFMAKGPLDMRFNKAQRLTADEVVNKYSRDQLIRVFRDYGEEKFAAKISDEILKQRKARDIADTQELFQIVEAAVPKPVKHKASDFARRIFQAIRIEVNGELDNLRKALPDILEVLRPGGRMVVVSFHSLEDRMVKEFINKAAKGCVCPPDFPQCVCGKNPLVRVLTKKPVTATERETAENPRSKPAKLRAAEKVK